MLREEIIKGLKIATRKIGGCYDNGGWLDNEEALARKSCEEAIKLLEQEPCEDCISRQEVLDFIDEMPSELTTDGRRMIRRRALEEYISDTLPPVTPQPKTMHEKQADSEKYQKAYDDGYEGGYAQARFDFEPKTGHWIFKNDNIAIPTGYYQCSECEIGTLLNKDNFCPNCGAKMVESQESEE